jgi:hypothetical protein
MKITRRLIALVVLLTGMSAASAAGAEEPPRPLRPQPVAAGAWEGPQFVQADKKGRVALLHARELSVVPVTDGDGLGESEKLASTPLESSDAVTRGAMGPHGDWVVRQGYDVRWFRNGKEIAVPAVRWPVWSVGMLDGRPVAAVVPSPIGRPSPDDGSELPILVEMVGKDWRLLAAAPEEELGGERMSLMQRHAAHLMVDDSGDLWLAYQYRYLIRQFSSAGRLKLEITIDDAEIALRDEAETAGDAAHERLARAQARMSKGSQARVNRAEEAIRALAEGRDGRYYFLAYVAGEKGGRGPHLDRFDPALGKLERVPLAVDLTGGASLAAGRDGLYLAAFSGQKGRWMTSWEDLEAAAWSEVDGVALDGFEPPQD